MRYNLLGRTGLYVSELCLGSMTFGKKGTAAGIDLKNFGEVSQSEADLLVNIALDAGVNFFDSAETYSGGEAERILGKALSTKRQDVIIATKITGRLSSLPDNRRSLTRKRIIEAVDGSLKRLETDYIDLYQLHTRDVHTPIDETLRALEDIVRSGKVRYIGCSNLMAWEVMKALGISEKANYTRFESIQAYYSIAGRELERDILPLVEDQRLGLLVWGPLAGGVLTNKFAEGKDLTHARSSHYEPPLVPPIDKGRLQSILNTLKSIADSRGATIAQVSISWLLHQRLVTSVLVGARNVEQLNENLKAVTVQLSKEELQALDSVSKLNPEYPQWIQPLPPSTLWR